MRRLDAAFNLDGFAVKLAPETDAIQRAFSSYAMRYFTLLDFFGQALFFSAAFLEPQSYFLLFVFFRII